MAFPALLRGPRHLLSPGRLAQLSRRCLSYVQGQSPEPRVREYFYYIDHQGQLFLDDMKVKNFITCFKDQDAINLSADGTPAVRIPTPKSNNRNPNSWKTPGHRSYSHSWVSTTPLQ